MKATAALLLGLLNRICFVDSDSLTEITTMDTDTSQEPKSTNTRMQMAVRTRDGNEVERDEEQPRNTDVQKQTEWAKAAQRILQSEILPRFPSQLTSFFQETINTNGPSPWTPPDDLYSQSSLYRNHVLIQPPFRRFPTSEEVRLSLDRLKKKRRKPFQKQQYLKRICTSNATQRKREYHQSATDQTFHQEGKSGSYRPPEPSILNDKHNSTEADPNTGTSSPPLPVDSDEAKRVDSDERPEKPPQDERHEKHAVVDYAGKSAGALVIEKSSGWKGTSSLLTHDTDQYAIVPAAEENKSLIIGLSEEILVKKVVLSNYERYSSTVKEFQILGSQTMAHWADFGFYTAKSDKFGRQEFELQDSANWARYLRFRIISHYGDEHYLTITQFSVHGTTMQQGFHEQWEEHEETDHDDPLDEGGQNEHPSANNNTPDTGSHALVATNSSLPDSSSTEPSLENDSEEEVSSIPGASATIVNATHVSIDEICSACQARRVGSNGYLLDGLYMPLLSAEGDCQWTALSSTCEAKTSTARSYSFGSRMHNTKINTLLPKSLLSSRPAVEPEIHTNHETVTKETFSLPPLHLEETAAVADLLARIHQETGEMLVLGEFKIKLSKAAKPVSNEEKDEVRMGTPITPDQLSPIGEDQERKQTDSGVGESPPDAQLAQRLHSEQDPDGTLFLEGGPGMDMLLERVPTASCLQDLNLTHYKNRSMQARMSASGAASNSPAAGGMEPIFKKLTGEIKILQASLSVHEKFAQDAVACFQRVLLDLVMLQEQERAEQNKRLEHIERFLNGSFLYHGFWNLASALDNALSLLYCQYTSGCVFSRVSDVRRNIVIERVVENPWWSLVAGFVLCMLCFRLYRRRDRTRGVIGSKVIK